MFFLRHPLKYKYKQFFINKKIYINDNSSSLGLMECISWRENNLAQIKTGEMRCILQFYKELIFCYKGFFKL